VEEGAESEQKREGRQAEGRDKGTSRRGRLRPQRLELKLFA
jgi:hypothetical protein